MTLPKLLLRLVRIWLSSAGDRRRIRSPRPRWRFVGVIISACSLLFIAFATRRPDPLPSLTTGSADAVHPAMLTPNATFLFPTQRGYTVFFESRPDVYSLVELDGQGKALSASRKIQVSDSVSAVRIGDRFFSAFARDRNRNEEGEPYMDDLSVWRYSPASGELVETFLLPKQAFIYHAGPKILTRKDGTFSVLWATYDAIIAARDFDAEGAPVGKARRSPSYGGNSAMFEVVPLGDTYLGVLAAKKESFGPSKLLLLAGLGGSDFPAARVLVDDIGWASGQLAMAVVPGARSAGVVWQSAGTSRLWFARVDETGFVGEPILVHESARTMTIDAFTARPDGFRIVWGESLVGTWVAKFSPEGRLAGPPRKMQGFLIRPAVAWTGTEWFFAEAASRDTQCPLYTGRWSADMDAIIERRCAF